MVSGVLGCLGGEPVAVVGQSRHDLSYWVRWDESRRRPWPWPCGRSQVARVEQNQLHFNGWRNGLAGVGTGRFGRWVEADCASQLNQHPVSAVRDWRVRFPTSCGLLVFQAAGMG